MTPATCHALLTPKDVVYSKRKLHWPVNFMHPMVCMLAKAASMKQAPLLQDFVGFHR